MSAPKVVELRPRELVVSLDDFDGIAAVRMLSTEMRREMSANKLQVKDLARKANLANNTVSRILNRDTQYPRHLTIILLYKALGFQAFKIIR
jgi:DNA-binding phage protein